MKSVPIPIRILVVDDHALVRCTIVDRLAVEPDLRVVGAADSAELGVSRALELEPDIVLMDIDLAGASGLDAARRIVDAVPHVRLIMLSAFVYDRYIDEAIAARACGYVSKREELDVLVTVIREVAGGRRYFSPEVTHRLAENRFGSGNGRGTRSRSATLTDREIEVLSQIARGLAKRDIAQQLKISVKTVETHTENLMAKLDIHDRVELARFAIRERLSSP
jgi:NarL family two-component system response regulator LiaR